MRRIRAALVSGLAGLSILGGTAACARDDVVTVSPSDDPALTKATAEARATLPVFWAKFEAHSPERSLFRLKVRFPTDYGGGEHLWFDVLDRDGDRIRGRLLNDPMDVTGLRPGQEMLIRPAAISDWAYVRGDKFYGAYAQRAVLSRLSPEERTELTATMASTPLESEDQH